MTNPDPVRIPPVADPVRAAPRAVVDPSPHGIDPGSDTDPPLIALVFDAAWYLETYPDVALRRIDPVQHYFAHGVAEGRNPNRYFDTKDYLARNPDVEQAGINPFHHFVFYGFREGRRPRPPRKPGAATG